MKGWQRKETTRAVLFAAASLLAFDAHALTERKADYVPTIVLKNTRDVYLNGGNFYQSKGDHDRAIADYTKAIELDPKFTAAYNNRGKAYERKGGYDGAKPQP
jgi:tetratricopeptide (TPR) repeat protein